ncbi:MAG: amidase domain-containing protein [Clostridiales bacterium]|jgi:hypothetical protein|nr:amidase domain-containing protein [Clostridiales bacterium]
MPVINIYNREKAVSYALLWSLKRNPRYYDFTNIGGDCTNFISQCIYAGSGVMNYTPVYGWYFVSLNNRAPAWTGVKYLYNFLTTNKTKGPFASEVNVSEIMLGDVIQLGDFTGRFYHSLFVTEIIGKPSIDTIFISTHTFDAKNRALSSYIFDNIRYLHINGVYN